MNFYLLVLCFLIRIAPVSAKEIGNSAIFLVIKLSVGVGQVIFCKDSQQTNFFLQHTGFKLYLTIKQLLKSLN